MKIGKTHEASKAKCLLSSPPIYAPAPDPIQGERPPLSAPPPPSVAPDATFVPGASDWCLLDGVSAAGADCTVRCAGRRNGCGGRLRPELRRCSSKTHHFSNSHSTLRRILSNHIKRPVSRRTVTKREQVSSKAGPGRCNKSYCKRSYQGQDGRCLIHAE